MSDCAVLQVADAIRDTLAAAPGFSAYLIVSEQSEDEAVPTEDQPVIVITALGIGHTRPDTYGALHHEATFDISVRHDAAQTFGVLTRANLNIIARIASVIHSSNMLAGRVIDIDPIDTGAENRGRDVAANSIQFRVLFGTPESDWFTLTT